MLKGDNIYYCRPKDRPTLWCNKHIGTCRPKDRPTLWCNKHVGTCRPYFMLISATNSMLISVTNRPNYVE